MTPRPDFLIGEEQVSRYLQQAKTHRFDAVITITNQFAALPTHHPVKLPKNATKFVALLHWSWAFIRATRPGKAETTYQALKDLRDSPELLEPDTSNTAPTTLEVVYEVDLAGTFSGRKFFVGELEKAVPNSYQEAGQLLKAWAKTPPKISKTESVPAPQDEDTDTGKGRQRSRTRKELRNHCGAYV